MTSQALKDLLRGLTEVAELQKLNPEPPGARPSRDHAESARAMNRASLVMISSHYERYIRGINEESCNIINSNGINSSRIPYKIKLLHSRKLIDSVSLTSWEHRRGELEILFVNNAWLWLTDREGTLQHNQLIDWMGSPKIANVLRYFKQWNIEDIFSFCSLPRPVEVKIRIRLKELVEKRNDIAHGNYNTSSDAASIKEYIACLTVFCTIIDRKFLHYVETL